MKQQTQEIFLNLRKKSQSLLCCVIPSLCSSGDSQRRSHSFLPAADPSSPLVLSPSGVLPDEQGKVLAVPSGFPGGTRELGRQNNPSIATAPAPRHSPVLGTCCCLWWHDQSISPSPVELRGHDSAFPPLFPFAPHAIPSRELWTCCSSGFHQILPTPRSCSHPPTPTCIGVSWGRQLPPAWREWGRSCAASRVPWNVPSTNTADMPGHLPTPSSLRSKTAPAPARARPRQPRPQEWFVGNLAAETLGGPFRHSHPAAAD